MSAVTGPGQALETASGAGRLAHVGAVQSQISSSAGVMGVRSVDRLDGLHLPLE
ncbi:hypothetical protein WDA79_09170 [Streptomyces sp. A475]|uniref:hypothetical protein n=1 Tax=Streptomyces sp. A475 TaxID=3131976 RepID=UPI0030C969C1